MYLTPNEFSRAFNDIKKSSMSHSTCKLVIFVSCLNIDALCSAKILCSLFKKELISYQLIPIVGYSELKDHFSKLDFEVSNVILLGCGAMVDLESFFDIDPNAFIDNDLSQSHFENDADDDKKFHDNDSNGIKFSRKIYILDGHRPWNLDNIFGSQMIVCFDDGLIDQTLESEKIAYNTLVSAEEEEFSSDSEDDTNTDEIESDADNNDDDEDAAKQDINSDTESINLGSDDSRKRKAPANNGDRKVRKRHLKEGEQLIEDYYSRGTTIETSITAQVYSLLSLIGETNVDNLWLSIIGTTSIDSQYPEIYKKIYPLFKEEVIRLNHNNEHNSIKTADTTNLTIDKDYYLFLLRHWSLYNSFYYSNYVNAKLTLWSEDGKKKLHKMFAKMGISLQIANQNWIYMDINVKKSLNSIFKKYLGLYSLDDLIREGFLRTIGFRGSISASECVESITALLEHNTESIKRDSGENSAIANSKMNDEDINDLMKLKEKLWIKNFWSSWDALDKNKMELIEKGLDYAKEFQKIVFRTGMAILEKRQLKNLRLYRLVVLREGPDLDFFKNPLILTRLGSWLLESCAELDSNLLPLVLAALDVETDTFLVMGLAPRYPRGSNNKDDMNQNPTLLNTFSIAFQQVANTSGAKVKIDSFESSVVEIRKDDLAPFLEKLTLSGLV